jgi:hypothetical protein
MLTQTLRRMERDGLLNANLPIPHRPLPSLTERPTTIRNAGLSTARSQAAAIARQPHSARLPNMPPRHTPPGPGCSRSWAPPSSLNRRCPGRNLRL